MPNPNSVSLRMYQEEIRKLVFVREEEATESVLWGKEIPARLDIYKNNTRSNWSDTLDYDFALTRKQFLPDEWANLRKQFFIQHPPAHWELNNSMSPFVEFIAQQPISPWIKDLSDYEWSDLQIFIDRNTVKPGSGQTNPTARVRVFQHQIFFWVQAGAPPNKKPKAEPEVLVFYRDAKNACHIREADPLMILLIEHFREPGARLEDVEPVRTQLLPNNTVPLKKVYDQLIQFGLILA